MSSLFVPDSESINNKLDIVKSKFDFVYDIKNTFSYIIDYLTTEDSEIPKIYINFDNSEGKFDYGMQGYALDMTWYSRFKPTVDLLIIGFTYLSFFWLVFKRIPEIISGSGLVTEKTLDYRKEVKK